MSEKIEILSRAAAVEKLTRLALEIAEHTIDETKPLVLLGIKDSGAIIAKKIAESLAHILPSAPEIYHLQFENGDLQRPVIQDLTSSLDDKIIVLIDDVSNSGKTIFYALKSLMNTHPHSIHTLVMVERQHKTFPIKSDFVGLSIATTESDYIHVETDNGEITGAYMASIPLK